MSNISDRAGTALLVIDVQKDVVAGNFEAEQRCANIATLVTLARQNQVPVIWVQHDDDELPLGSPGWELVDVLVPEPREAIVHKNYRSSFENTQLDDLLEKEDIHHLILCGSQSNYCVRNTLHAAIERGYDVTLAGDAHTTCDEHAENMIIPGSHIVNELNRVCDYYELPGRTLQTKNVIDIFN